MNEFRVFLAVIIFSISSYLVYDLFANGFSWVVLLFCIAGYTSVHYIWPKQKSDESIWYDFLENIVDLPFRTIAYLLRALARVLKGGDGDIGIDL